MKNIRLKIWELTSSILDKMPFRLNAFFENRSDLYCLSDLEASELPCCSSVVEEVSFQNGEYPFSNLDKNRRKNGCHWAKYCMSL